jgi:hypothetical protein
LIILASVNACGCSGSKEYTDDEIVAYTKKTDGTQMADMSIIEIERARIEQFMMRIQKKEEDLLKWEKMLKLREDKLKSEETLIQSDQPQNLKDQIVKMRENLKRLKEEKNAMISKKKMKRDIIEEYKKELSSVSIAFNTPQKMEQNETTIVNLLLSHSYTLDKLKVKIEKTIIDRYRDNQHQKITTERIKLATLIKIDLAGSEGFMIRKIGTHTERVISKNNIEEWKWEVKAVEVGIQHLFLEIYAIMKLEGEDKYLQLKSFSRKIEVYISVPSAIKNFFSKYWQWLIAAIASPLTLTVRRLIFSWRKKRKEVKKEEPVIKTPPGL